MNKHNTAPARRGRRNILTADSHPQQSQAHTYIRTLDKAHNESSARLESAARTVASWQDDINDEQTREFLDES